MKANFDEIRALFSPISFRIFDLEVGGSSLVSQPGCFLGRQTLFHVVSLHPGV